MKSRSHATSPWTDASTAEARDATARISTAQTIWLALGFFLTLSTFLTIEPTRTDFRTFYDRALVWRGGHSPADPYFIPNLNSPVLDPIVAPLTFLPEPVAFWVWTLLGVAALFESLRLIVLSGEVPRERWPWVIGAIGVSMPCLIGWSEGQVTWLFLYPATRAWRSSSPWIAGLWLAPLIAIKPSLAFWAICLPWATCFRAGLGSAVIAGAWFVLQPQAWFDWLHTTSDIHWMGWPLNGSVWGILARLADGQVRGLGLQQLFRLPPIVLSATILLCAIGWGLTRLQPATVSQRWARGHLWMLLAFPLGQIYYLPMALGPLAASWRRSRLSLAALVCLSIPMGFLSIFGRWPLGNILAGSVYGVGVICAWLAWTTDRQSGRASTDSVR